MSYGYLGQPYSHPSEAVRFERYKLGQAAFTSMLRKGIYIYSPIVHCHYAALLYDLPTDAEFWRAYNEEMLKPASTLYILTIDGWQESDGLRDERAIASAYNIPEMFVKMGRDFVCISNSPS